MNAHLLMLGMDQPVPPHGGTRLRLLHLARQAATRHDVSMWSMGEPSDEFDEPFALEGVEWGRSRMGALIGSVRRPYLYSRLHSTALRNRVALSGADLIQTSSIYYADVVAPMVNTPVILDAHNVEAEIVRSQAKSDASALHRLRWGWESRTTDRFEKRAVGQADAVLACSDIDAAHFEPFAKRVVVVPNGVDVAATPFRPVPPTPQLAYLGMYSYRPNEIAAMSLIDEIFPLVIADRPDATLRLIGANPTADMQARASEVISITGRVEDAVHELQKARVLVISLKAGSGTRLKAIEAMAAGVVVVSTSTGIAGLDVVDGEHALVADTPRELAAAVTRVLDDDALASRLAENARTLVQRRFDWSRCAEPMLEIQDELLAQRRS